ncbi:MAG: methyltransferase domain-containing protein, partial [Deltaproteobacteria bacterium]|nr:methyltransferase domain-containing protein [Deltaproteobacteria bacterium]
MVERTLDQTSQEWNVAVDGYEESFEPFTAQFAQEAIRLADIKEGENVLDVAAGPGALTLAAAKAGAKVVAIDFSPQMIHRLRARVQGESLDNVAAHVMDGEALEFL